MDSTLTSLRATLHTKLRDVGYRLDATRDPDTMKALISSRKRLQASLAIVEDSLARVRVANVTRIVRDEPTPFQGRLSDDGQYACYEV
jgi:hypothetical protein